MTQPPQPVTVYRSPNPRRYQAVWVSIAVLALFPGSALAILRLLGPTDDTSALFASFIPYGIVFDLIALIFSTIALVRGRNRPALGALVGLSALLLIMQVIWIGPQFVADDRPAGTAPITVFSLNLQNGHADLDQLEQEVADADVISLVEVTPKAYRQISRRLAAKFEHRTPPVRGGNNESMVLSRYPLSDVQRLESLLPQLSVTVELPEIGPTNLIAAHPCNPYCGDGLWATEHRQLLQHAESLPDRPTIIVGDFNAILDQRPMRALEAAGFTSATDIVGAGWQPTYPSNTRLPPMLEIDHVMLDDRLTATAIETVEVARTDHLGLRVEIAGVR